VGDDLAGLATDAYIYGFPLVCDLHQVTRVSRRGLGSLPPAPFNSFGHASALAGPDAGFVSVNNDTIYSIAQVDVSGGPLLLRVPDTAGRYYVLQFVDAWTNNFAYVGRRATGTKPGSFLLVPHDWQGDAPAGTRVVVFPTPVATIVGRWACYGEADLAAVSDLQHELSIEPYLSAEPLRGLPVPAPVPDELMFFEQMRTWMRAFPPSRPDRAYQQRFAPLGLLDPVSPYGACPPELSKALAEGMATAKLRIEEELAKGTLAPNVNGWTLAYHIFDYNLDHFGLGTVDDPAWQMADRTASYLARALAARGGLWGNHGYEAAYPMTYKDADGDQLDGRNQYVLRFTELPPVDAFWSITMYDLPDFHLVANRLGRYSIGDRTPGLRRDHDGSITIRIQHSEPADTSNWLPAPPAPFRPIMRLYQPRAEVLNGSYTLPAIVKARDLPRCQYIGHDVHYHADSAAGRADYLCPRHRPAAVRYQ
jgi:hypothetical protein